MNSVAKEQSSWQRISEVGHAWAIPLILFVLPLHKHIVPPVIVAVFLFHCFFSRKKDIMANLRTYRWLALPVLFFLAHVVGMIHTENVEVGWFKVQVKLSFLLFPVLMILRPQVNRAFLVRCMKAFILGCIATIAASLVVSGIDYLETKSLSAFTYVNATYFIHTSYLAMYLNLCLLMLVYSIVRSNLLGWSRWILAAISALFIFYIMLLVSKTGLLMLGLTFMAVIALSVVRSARPWAAVMIFVLFTGLIIGAYYSFDFIRLRVDNFIWYFEREDWLDNSSMAVRAWTWVTGWELLQSSFWIGYGTGDVQAMLTEGYTARDLQYHLDYNLNAHNQFLETGLAMGIVVPVCMILGGLALTLRWLKRRMWFGAGFLLMVGINFITESMLETQAGNVFIGLFLALFIAISAAYKPDANATS